MKEVIEEKQVLTNQGVFQTIRNYNYDENIVEVLRLFNGQVVSQETFYLD